MINDRELEKTKLREENANILAEFKKTYPHKYEILDETPLGMGAYGAVYKALDIDRTLEVAIKIHHKGIAPEGSARGWAISTMTNHPQVANTYTIETFENQDLKTCKAVVTKLIPGVPLQKLWDNIEELSPANREIIQEDLAHSLIPSILNALRFCHVLGYGHGDLHAGNVITFLSDLDKRYIHNAILIDFDNSSIRGEILCSNENEKIEKDYRAVKRMISQTISDWYHFDVLNILVEAYDEVCNLFISWEKVMQFIDLSKTNGFNKNVIFTFLKSLIGLEVTKENLQPILTSIAQLCKKLNKEEDCKWAIEDFDEAYQQYENLSEMRLEMTIIENAEVKTTFYKKLFGG
ncbi:protein kinase family protein [Pedobacter panaciterrae]|uniref:protein kinase family protein n=1 Tax=Pedobacter panaciterrae TaxID=363849 RepID=UPI00155DCFE0|nr:protein kinase family protein [Pedobacter panaciterrae]NQX53657.1 protein kinase family protein [Pedobacter panaciterrae]